MSTEHARPTPEQAREQLMTGEGRLTSSPMDRRIHAGVTAGLGVTLGLAMASRNALSESGRVMATVLLVAIWLGAFSWVQRVTHTVPRRAKLYMRLGTGASLFGSLVAVVPWLNLQAQAEPNTWLMVILAALLIALPSLLAAGIIARGRG